MYPLTVEASAGDILHEAVCFQKERKIHGRGRTIRRVRTRPKNPRNPIFKVGGFDDVVQLSGCGEAGLDSLSLNLIQSEEKRLNDTCSNSNRYSKYSY